MNDATAAGRGPAQAHQDDPNKSRDEREDQRKDPSTDESAGQVSSASSSFENLETAVGGADSVPDTPDRNSDPQ
jgi:hypothetical protein